MIKEQQKTNDVLPGEHEANAGRGGPDWVKHNEGREQLSLKHPCNRRKKDEKKRF